MSKFNRDDLVIVSVSPDNSFYPVNGLRARVLVPYTTEYSSTQTVVVEFLNKENKSIQKYAHSCFGRVPSGLGMWMRERDLLLERDYEKEANFEYHGDHRVIYNNPATIVILNTGEKGVAKCLPEDDYDKNKGYQIALVKAKLKQSKKDLNKANKIFRKIADSVDELEDQLDKLTQ